MSTVADEELSAVRVELAVLKEEIQRGVALSRNATETTVNLVGESRKRDTEWMQLSFNQLKAALANLDADLKEARAQLFDLSSAYATAVASADANHSCFSGQIGALSERLATTEARSSQLVMEMDQGMRTEHEELLRWFKDAQPQLAALKGFDGVQSLTESVHAHTSALQQCVTPHAHVPRHTRNHTRTRHALPSRRALDV